MIYATKISFNRNEENHILETIARIYLEFDDDRRRTGWYSREDVYAGLMDEDLKIKVKHEPYPLLEPVYENGVEYVRSERDYTDKDNLLKLPNVVNEEIQ